MLWLCCWPCFDSGSSTKERPGRVISYQRSYQPLSPDQADAFMRTFEYNRLLQQRAGYHCYYVDLNDRVRPWVNPDKKDGKLMSNEEAEAVCEAIKSSFKQNDKNILESQGIVGIPQPKQMLREVEKTSEFFAKFLTVCCWNPCFWSYSVKEANERVEDQRNGMIVCQEKFSVFNYDGTAGGVRTVIHKAWSGVSTVTYMAPE